MECPQCAAEVPSDDAFCGKCGYAMRDRSPERLDQSWIRVHEEPAPPAKPASTRSESRQRIRKHTVLGIQSLTPPRPTPAPAPSAPLAPTEPPRSRGDRTRTPHKTMIGIPRDEIPMPVSAPMSSAPDDTSMQAVHGDEASAAKPITQSHRARARVRYDSANESLPVTQRRRKALRGLAVLVLFAAAWLGYRFLTLNG